MRNIIPQNERRRESNLLNDASKLLICVKVKTQSHLCNRELFYRRRNIFRCIFQFIDVPDYHYVLLDKAL